jgi:LPXTG-motif cell wall-anchored protein
VTSPPSEVTIEAPHTPGIELVKTSDAATITAVGQTVTYSFLVTNTGNVTLSSVAVTEGAFTGAGDLSEVACPETSLLPGEEIVCTASYTVQEADLTGAALSNTATASAAPPGDGTGGGDPITSDPSTSESGSVVLSEDLPTTGAQIGWGLALGALVLLLLGGALVLARHSRRGADEVLPH